MLATSSPLLVPTVTTPAPVAVPVMRPVLYQFSGPERYMDAWRVVSSLSGWCAVGVAVFPGVLFVSVGQWSAAAEYALPATANAIAAHVHYRNWSHRPAF